MLQGTQTPSFDSPQIWNWKEIYNFVRSKIIDADVSWPGSVDGIKSEHMAAIEKATNEFCNQLPQLGADKVAKSTPDGYTLLMAIDTMTMTPAVYKSMPFDPINDLAPIARLAVATYAMAINNDVPAKDLPSLLNYIKNKPGQLNYGTPGNGTPHHLVMEYLKNLKGLDMLHVPYKGLAGAQTDLIGGQVQVMFATFNSLLPLGKGNKIKLLAVTGAKRSELMPDIPTFTEQGIPEMENLFPWYAVLSPANTPKDLQNKIYKDFSEVMQLEEIKKQLNEQGIFVRLSTSEQLKDLIKTDIDRWKKLVQQANIPTN